MLSQAPNRVIFKLVDPADLSWLRESGFSREEIDIVKTLPHGKAAVIAVSRTACYQKFGCFIQWSEATMIAYVRDVAKEI